tara:strand:- start:64150 stop:64680 length:531 start_codon:yes stop_codon:yes gene_type:complete
MIQFIADKFLARRLKKVNRKIGAINLAMAKSALLIYDASNVSTEKRVRDFARFLKEEGVKTDTIGFYKLKGKEDKRPEDELTYSYYDKNCLNRLGFPKDNKILKMIGKEYHLMIDLNFDINFSLKVISTLSKAHFKIGRAVGYQNDICDLTISTDNKKLDFFLSQTTTYLKMINKK